MLVYFFEHPLEHIISHFYRIPFMEETLITKNIHTENYHHI